MPRRTAPRDVDGVDVADDLESVVIDKRAGWRANQARARRRQRRYKKRLVDELVLRAREPGLDDLD